MFIHSAGLPRALPDEETCRDTPFSNSPALAADFRSSGQMATATKEPALTGEITTVITLSCPRTSGNYVCA